MLGTLIRRVTVKTLDVVVDKGRSSEHAPLRAAASALDRVRGVVGLDVVEAQAPLPTWSGDQPDQPMWASDRKKLRKHQLEKGIIRDEDEDAAASSAMSAEAAPVIKVYYKRGCPYSRAAMDLLREREFAFEEHDIKGDDATLSWLKIVTGQQTTPQIFIHGKSIGGFEELRALDQSGELRQRLERAPDEGEDEPAGDEALVDEMEIADLRARIDAGAQVRLCDVRTAAEVEQGIIAGAMHVPLQELDARHGELDAADVWVVYCKSGRRSLMAVQALRGHGFRSAVSLRGGIDAWVASGGAVVALALDEAASAPRRLPVLQQHPERSPFEDLAVGDGSVSMALEGDELVARVREVLDECRPLVQADGGDIELLDVQGNVVHVRLTGNCIGCPSSKATLEQGIARRLKLRIPQIIGIASPQLG
ncbi:NifU family protein [Paraliomyxa miuraensis]|uniref:NifU family protein n=1 Tax=Paraliomyxa miuraensis TaxID=376150 RepID=UPI00225A668D|nr:NifU family protein [Paraliomyxa miuraensis]MCX4246870.1 NifU family protein [Paraliomyxa miuraensis]